MTLSGLQAAVSGVLVRMKAEEMLKAGCPEVPWYTRVSVVEDRQGMGVVWVYCDRSYGHDAPNPTGAIGCFLRPGLPGDVSLAAVHETCVFGVTVADGQRADLVEVIARKFAKATGRWRKNVLEADAALLDGDKLTSLRE